ncbi:MAG: ABC transporter permease [Candidatus Thermoplasmatota archaeon]|nr:ABC transporter permease [Candidatus Thermoplasmatota archaeon]
MNHFANLVRKEVRELLTPATLVPILVMALIFGGMGNVIGGATEEAEKQPTIGLVNHDSGELGQLAVQVMAAQADIVYNQTGEPVAAGIAAVKAEGGAALLVIPANFSSNIMSNVSGRISIYWIMEGAGLMDSISSGAVQSIVQSVEYAISHRVIEQGDVNASFALSPLATHQTTYFKGREMAGISPGDIGAVLAQQSTVVPIIMMIIVIMAGGMVISSMGMEKENKTLETLLTLPVRRGSIVAGKIAGAALVGLVMAVIYMLGFSYYFSSFQVSGEVDLAAYGLTLTTREYLLIGVSLFLALTAALSLCMVLGTFAKSYKSAQTLTVPISVLALIPMFLIMFRDFATLSRPLQAVLFAIPFSHPMMAMRALLFDDYGLVLAGIAYVALFALAMMALAVWIFRTDRLLTGSLRWPRRG